MASPITNEPPLNSKKPSNSAFKQQKLPAWQPILTAGTVLPTFFIIGLTFIPIGIGLLVTSDKVQEYQREYTLCENKDDDNVTCDELLAAGFDNCTCEIKFNLTTQFKKDVFVYYGLTNFYQNHRRYVKSRDDAQLRGYVSQASNYCAPYAYTKDDNDKICPIVPCGAIANSLFNDVIKLFLWQGEKKITVPLLKHDIAWPTDKSVKFRNPEGRTLQEAFKGTCKPINWSVPVYKLDPTDESNNGLENEDLIVWMRTAALPTFRKLYRRVDHTQSKFVSGLPEGEYSFEITYRFRVTPFRGTKRIIISNTSWLGGKNYFLGIMYIVVGSICLLLAVVFLIIHFRYGKNTLDLVNISQRTAYR